MMKNFIRMRSMGLIELELSEILAALCGLGSDSSHNIADRTQFKSPQNLQFRTPNQCLQFNIISSTRTNLEHTKYVKLHIHFSMIFNDK